ncbi:hypothetical protein GWO43_20085 [candidate division KSB1 bacterium]|nr:hypothetical protein [candidate division KSB1 bacterium]NIR71664.1 hypothetical protein [candidate division KSB1 bacterium]NIS26376.1 hypothetical protein [candidate division KSB1 bacterium]NIT73135.1 hypothetical protein [candidate division KSB1 bacterium]NIU27062.1 hypothetical protein [candidate division KSB1 bacterium]
MATLAKRIQHAAAWRSRRAIANVQDFNDSFRAYLNRRRFEKAQVDPRITYPCYKSLDEYIDVERLKSLDGYLKKKVERHLKAGKCPEFHTGFQKLKLLSRTKPGSKLIPLTVSKQPYNYLDLDKPELWEPSEYASDFADLMDFIDTLPFKATARIMIMADDKGRAVSAHRDHTLTDVTHEFIWFRTNLDKPFYMQNRETKEKVYVDSYSAWFDTVNQFHGGDRTGTLAISIRVDGIFSDEFRAQIPTPACNPASIAALWASLSN